MENNQDLIIDETNFHTFFRDCRNANPEKGDILAKYSAIAEFVAGPLKADIIHMLKNFDRAIAATKIVKKVCFATEKDSVRICREICEDLAAGLSEQQVEDKIYSYEMEMFYYTKKEYFPIDDPHWSSIGLLNLEEFLNRDQEHGRIESKIIFPESYQDTKNS